MSLFPNQIVTAKQIVDGFLVGSNYTVLLAQMQSGKSDTYMLVGAELVRTGLIEKFVVFSGNAEVALREQAQQQEYFWEKYEEYLYELLGEGRKTRDVVRFVKHTWNSDSVLWSNDLLKYEHVGGKTLFIWDESHVAQTGPTTKLLKGNRPCQFFQKIGLAADGSPNPDGHLMLSVSATPFSEIIVNEKHSQPKNVVCMPPGAQYRGLKQMMEDDQIVPFKANGRWSNLVVLFSEISEQVRTNGVGIVRATGDKVVKLQEICKGNGIPCHLHDISDKAKINDLLETHTGVIIVKGKVKMGQQIEKRRIKWCMETAVVPNTDTFLQSLVGRCMGYHNSGTHAGIKIYVSEKFWNTGDAQKYIDMMEHYENNQHVHTDMVQTALCVPEHAMNVKKGTKSNAGLVPAGPFKGHRLFRTCPDKVSLDLSEWDGTQSDFERVIIDFISGGGLETHNNTDYVKHMLAGKVDGNKKVTLSSFKDNAAAVKADFHNEMERLVKTKHVLSTPGTSLGCLPNEIKLWHGLENKRKWAKIRELRRCGKPLVCFLQYLSTHSSEQATSLPKTTMDEVFSNQTEAGNEVLQNGGFTNGLKIETATIPNAMEAALLECIQTPLNSVLIRPREVTSNHSANSSTYKGITVSSGVYTALQPGGSIYKACQEKMNVKLKLTKPRGKKPKGAFWDGHTRLACISW